MNQFMIKYLEKIVNIPSPSGFTGRLMEVLGDDARTWAMKYPTPAGER